MSVLGMLPFVPGVSALRALKDAPNTENALSGYDTSFPITHESSSPEFDGVIRNKTPYSVFDGIFGLGGVKGNALGSGQGANYTYLPRTGKVAGSGDVDLEYGKSVEFLKKQFPKASDDQIDSLYRATAEDAGDFSSFEDSTFDGLLYGDAGERSWMAQNLRGKMAVDQGFDAVAMSDENGTSYFIPYGSKAKNIGTNFDWDSYNRATTLLPSPLEGTLDMSQAARMQRKAEGKFVPTTGYHGTSAHKSEGQLFDEFQLFEGDDLTRSVSRSPVGKLGVSIAHQPEMASDFAYQASPADGEGATIMPLTFRSDKAGTINLSGDETNDEIFGTVVDAWKDGYDAIHFTNYTTPAGTKGSFTLIKDPAQVRSVNAAFDPAKRDSANLMAGAAGGAIGLSALRNIQRDEERQPD
jgi:hypothetical protein